jgi:hypothetical protein
MLRLASLLVGVGCVVFGGSAARGAVWVYPHDRAGFQASLASFTTYGFEASEGFPTAPAQVIAFGGGAIHASVTVDGSWIESTWVQPNPYASGGQVLQGVWHFSEFGPSASLTIQFDNPVRAVGFDYLNSGSAGGKVWVHTSSGGVPLEFGIGNLANTDFWGMVSDTPITQVDVMDLANFPYEARERIDNLTVSSVPEPSVALVAALASLVLCRRRGR